MFPFFVGYQTNQIRNIIKKLNPLCVKHHIILETPDRVKLNSLDLGLALYRHNTRTWWMYIKSFVPGTGPYACRLELAKRLSDTRKTVDNLETRVVYAKVAKQHRTTRTAAHCGYDREGNPVHHSPVGLYPRKKTVNNVVANNMTVQTGHNPTYNIHVTV